MFMRLGSLEALGLSWLLVCSLVLSPLAMAQQVSPTTVPIQPEAEPQPLPAPPFSGTEGVIQVLPPQPTAAAEDLAQASSLAAMDAQSDTNRGFWLGAGCLFSFVGIAAGYLVSPTPPISRLVGRSPEYVMVYSDSYARSARSVQGRMAIIGCAASTLVFGFTYAMFAGYPAY